MNISHSPLMIRPIPDWEDIVDDFLELACVLAQKERGYLLDALRQRKISAKAIQTHPTFSIGGKVIVICNGVNLAECWVYYPKKMRIIRKKITELDR